MINNSSYSWPDLRDHRFPSNDYGSCDQNYSKTKKLLFNYELRLGVSLEFKTVYILPTPLKYQELSLAEHYESKNSLNTDYSKDTDVETLGNFNPITEESGQW